MISNGFGFSLRDTASAHKRVQGVSLDFNANRLASLRAGREFPAPMVLMNEFRTNSKMCSI
jgi:hypothetical protein